MSVGAALISQHPSHDRQRLIESWSFAGTADDFDASRRNTLFSLTLRGLRFPSSQRSCQTSTENVFVFSSHPLMITPNIQTSISTFTCRRILF
jgi:hypothetical protein